MLHQMFMVALALAGLWLMTNVGVWIARAIHKLPLPAVLKFYVYALAFVFWLTPFIAIYDTAMKK
jgi:hypothetical protein